MIPLTALVLTYNEKENIGRTLAALSGIEEVVVIDSFSTDDTIDIAKQSHANVCVLQRKFDNHVAQWNFGLEQVRTPWVLTLDADYEISSELSEEIARLAPGEEIAGYQASFEYRIYGRPLRASVYPPRTVLFRRDRSSYRDDGHTQILETNGPVLPLTGKIFHDDRKPFSRWLESQNRYAWLEASHLLSRPLSGLNFQDRLRRAIFFAPPILFLYLLLARGLILDGWPGWFYVSQRTVAELLLSVRLLTGRKTLEGKSWERDANDSAPVDRTYGASSRGEE